jgi:RNA polymerase sigma factor (sigma-70 family)
MSTQSTAEESPNALGAYLSKIGDIPVLTLPEEQALGLKAIAGCTISRQKLVTHNLKYVVHLAKRVALPSDPVFLDLIASGNVGLVKVAGSYDPKTQDIKLIGYAHYPILHSMHQFLAKETHSLSAPTHRVFQSRKLSKTLNQLREQTSSNPSDEDLSQYTGISLRDINSTRSLHQPAVSLDAPLGEDGGTNHERIGLTVDTTDADSSLEQVHLNAALDDIPTRTAYIIRARFGLDGKGGRTLEEIGTELGLTRERVRQIQDRALRTLKLKLSTQTTQFVQEPKKEVPLPTHPSIKARATA